MKEEKKDKLKTEKKSKTPSVKRPKGPKGSKGPKKPEDPNKEPRNMDVLHRAILDHPEYKTKLTESTRWCFENGCVAGFSSCTKENNKWSREIWRFLYKDIPLPKYH